MKLKIVTEVSLHEPCVDFGFVTWMDVDVLEDDDDRRVGQARVAIIHAGSAINYGEPLYEALDADSGELEALHEVYFEAGWLRPAFHEGVGSDVLYIADVSVDKERSGKGIELAVVRRLCDTIASSCALAVVPYETEDEARQWVHIGFEKSPSPSEGGDWKYLHLRIAMRTARVVEDREVADTFLVVPNPAPGAERKQH